MINKNWGEIMHGDERYQAGKRVSIISLVINLFLSVIKITVGFLYNSKALIADGFHSVSDMASTFVVMLSMKYSKVPPDENHPYGHGKAEAVGTIILSVTLIITGFIIAKDSISSIFSGAIAMPGNITLIAALISIGAKEALYQYTVKIGEKINSKGLIADAHHHRSDAFSSVAALIGIGGARLGYKFFDPLAGLVVAILILKVGIEILIDASHELMDGMPNQEKIDNISQHASEIKGVLTVSDVKVRSYGPRTVVDLTLVVKDTLSVIEGHAIASKVKEKIIEKHENVEEVMVHVDPEKIYLQNKDNH